jgi:hypothetical protein
VGLDSAAQGNVRGFELNPALRDGVVVDAALRSHKSISVGVVFQEP